MKRLPTFFSGIGAMALILALSQAAQAQQQVGSNPDRDETVKITVSGEIDLDYVYRSREITAYTESFSRQNAVTPGFPAPDTSDSENTLEGFAAVRTDIELSNNVTAVVEFGTRRLDDEEILEFGGEAGQDPVLRELSIRLGELLSPSLTLEIGIPRWSFNPSGRGGSLAFEPGRSQTFVRNLDSVGQPTVEEVDDNRLGDAAFPNELDPVGGVFTYQQNEVSIDVVILPAVIEGGAPEADEALYAVDGFYTFDENGSRIGAIVAVSSVQLVGGIGGDTAIITVGGGATLNNIVGGFSIFGEAYFQTGDAGEFGGNDLDAAGFAAQGGIEWNHLVGNPMPIKIGAKVTHYSGDDDSAATDTDVDRFVSYESVNDLLIIENMYFGLDVDSNYTAFKIYGGTAFTLVQENDLSLDVMVGITSMTEEINFVGSGAGGEDGLGNEVDFKASWSVTKQVVIDAAIAFLFSSDVLEESMNSNALVGPNVDEADDSALLWTIGAALKF